MTVEPFITEINGGRPGFRPRIRTLGLRDTPPPPATPPALERYRDATKFANCPARSPVCSLASQSAFKCQGAKLNCTSSFRFLIGSFGGSEHLSVPTLLFASTQFSVSYTRSVKDNESGGRGGRSRPKLTQFRLYNRPRPLYFTERDVWQARA